MTHVLIPTYNRPQALANLVRDLRSNDERFRLVIANDGSTKDYSEVDNLLTEEDKHIRLKENHGKQWFYKVINALFAELRGKEYEYVFKLDDDLRLVDDFFEKAISRWKQIPSEKKLAMGLITDSRTGQGSWNGVPSSIENGLWKQGWIDMIWMAEYGFLEHFGCQLPSDYFERKRRNGFWKEYPKRSSQVGKWLTLNLWQDGRFWNVAETLVYHGNHKSKLNPLERKRNPLTTNQ